VLSCWKLTGPRKRRLAVPEWTIDHISGMTRNSNPLINLADFESDESIRRSPFEIILMPRRMTDDTSLNLT
jgi:hypothetical protein